MKLKMKFYTFCTIILLVQLSKSEINKSLRHYDVIKKEQFIHNIVKRGASDSDHKFNKIREIDFHALGKNFRLILSPKKSLFSGNFKAVEVDSSHDGERLVEINRDDWYEGRVFGESGSSAQVHLEDGVMTGRIQTRNEVYHVEPAWRHLDTAPRDTMVAYRESDVDLSWMGTEEGSKCAAVKETGIVEEGLLHESLNNRSRRSAHFSPIISDDKSPRLTRCPLMLVADYKFYKEMGGSSTKTTVAYLISLVDRVHKLYEETVWTDGQDQGFSGMGFSIKKIVVHTSPTPVKAGSEHYNMLRASWDVRHLLEVFSREPSHRDYCLAHLFTDMAFDGGILGLAYVGSPRSGSVGGVCSPRYFKSGHTLYLNTGNHYGQRVITREADLVTAHEFGHNWGSEHDPDIPECSPSASQGGSYLMYTYSVAGYDVNNKKFSPCSLRFIKKVLQSKSSHCFTEPEESFCGNLRVEGEEECDAGNLGSEARDACCDQNCKLRPGALCSDKNSPCCHKCEYEKAGTTCRTANLATCEQEAACSGYSATCPKSQATEDGATCQDQGTCLAGRCAPFCEARGGQSCMCDDGDACHRCCRSSFNATCSVALPAEVLADGTPCYRGLCNGGVCEATSQDVVRFWDIVDDINFNLVSKIFKDNLVMIIIVLSLLVWIPLSCLVSWLDQKRAEAEEEEWEWRRQGDLVHPRDRRQVVTVRVPRRSRQENTEIVNRHRDQNQE